MEEREGFLDLVIDFFLSQENVLNGIRVDDLDFSGKELKHGFDELLHGALSDGEEGVLHSHLDLSKEALKLALLIHVAAGFVKVEPGLWCSRWLLKVFHDGLLDGFTPLVLEVVRCRSDGAVLRAFEVSHTHCMSDVAVVDVSKVGVITLLADNLLYLYHFILAKQGIKAEL